MSVWKTKIVGHDRVAPDQLLAQPLNFRTHPQAQRDALAAAIDEVGFIRSVTVNKTTGHLLDGHERVWQALTSEHADLICFGRWHLANPDFVRRLALDAPLNDYDRATFYSECGEGKRRR